jgi:dTDP-4-dehydrorhamnose 3,5-epimerase
MPFRFQALEIEGVILIEPKVFADTRGFFMESFKRSDFEAAGVAGFFVQENHSRSRSGILRGLHYQCAPKAQGKLVRVIAGEIYDVAVDIREHSPTHGKWVAVPLSAENRRMLYIPPWCAHGFLVLSEEAEVVYKTTEEYSPDHERGILWNDPQLAISWPVVNPVLSERDQLWPGLPDTAAASDVETSRAKMPGTNQTVK